jgi:hypothetical protein
VAFIHGYQYAFFDLLLELPDRRYDQRSDRFRENILRSNLNHAGSIPSRGGKYGAEIEIVSQNRIAAIPRVSKKFCVGRSW